MRCFAVVALVGGLLAATPSVGAAAPDDAQTNPAVREMTFPVVGPVTYSDTWGACRGRGCRRAHKGADIFGPKLAPLVAAADGAIVSVRRTGATSAGNKIVIEDDDGWRYVYFHLNNDSPGTDDGANPQAWIIANRLRVGDRVQAGDVVGYLGDSGNAERTPNHVHFELHVPGGGAINPTPSLDEARASGRVVPVVPLASTAEGRAEQEAAIVAWYAAILDREPTADELFAWADRMAVGLGDRNDLIADLTMASERHRPAGTAVRASQVAFGRLPTMEELQALEGADRDGFDHIGIVRLLLDSEEFIAEWGALPDAEFIEVIYRNARGRSPSANVRRYWTNQLAGGRDRSEMAGYFVDSYGLKSRLWHELEVVQAFRATVDRLPTDEELDHWVHHLDDGGLVVDVVAAIGA